MFEKFRNQHQKMVKIETRLGEYYVNSDGQVVDLNSGPVGFGYNTKGEKIVTIDIGYGVKSYRISLLILLGYSKLNLPHEYLDMVEPFHIDGRLTNFHPSNIGYRYIEPIEVRNYPGFYYIPFFNLYGINKEGVVVNTHTGGRPKWYISKPPKNNPKNMRYGYRVTTMKGDPMVMSISRHRAMALTFLYYPDNVDNLIVNHLDGVPGNDWVENFEWTTPLQNLNHAIASGLRSQNIFCWGKNVFTGEEKEFYSLSEAGRQVGSDSASMAARLRAGGQKLYTGGWMFKSDPNEPWRDVERPWAELKSLPTATKVTSKNIFTGEVRKHASISQVGYDLGLEDVDGPRGQIKQNWDRPYFGYLFRTEGDETPWPEFSERDLLVFKDNPRNRARGVVAKHEDGSELFFTNIKKTQEYFSSHLRRTTDVCKAIVRKRVLNGYRFFYYEPKVRSSSDR